MARPSALSRLDRRNGAPTIGIDLPLDNDLSVPTSGTRGVPNLVGHAERAALADRLGFAALWVRDVPIHDPVRFGDACTVFETFTFFGHLAVTTENAVLGTAAVVLPLRGGLLAAKAAASVDVLSGGRFVFGVASGDRAVEYPLFGVDFDRRGQTFRESVATVRAAWRTPLPGDGISAPELGLDAALRLDVLPKPVSGGIPLVVAGKAQQSLEWIAEHADGWFNYPRDLAGLTGQIEQYDSSQQGVGTSFATRMANLCAAEPDVVYFAGRGRDLAHFMSPLRTRPCADRKLIVLSGDDASQAATTAGFNEIKDTLESGNVQLIYTGLAHPGAWTTRGSAYPSAAVSTFLLSYQVAIWLATDAPLLATVSVALLGTYVGFYATSSRERLRGYLLMHAALGLGFLSKSAVAWMVPAMTILTLSIWEKRWRELFRWELYAGLLLQAALILTWVWFVYRGDNGAEHLKVFFWNNLVGRFSAVDAPPELQYAAAHRNFPGKYLIELPLYLFPWTLLVIAAARRAWRQRQTALHDNRAVRFALAALEPLGQLGDGLGLIAARRVGRSELEGHGRRCYSTPHPGPKPVAGAGGPRV